MVNNTTSFYDSKNSPHAEVISVNTEDIPIKTEGDSGFDIFSYLKSILFNIFHSD